ncbi:MAG: hypothetical protein H0W71_04120 [Sphingomonas sp.]|nr:hypothetical protein [Sphingomonas sp.]
MIAAADGRVLRSADLVGAIIGVRLHGAEQRIRIDEVRADPVDPTLLLHSISLEQQDGRWQPLCEVAPDGTRAAYPLAGHSTADGKLQPGSRGEIEIVCTSGAHGKCARSGYHPWQPGILPLFNACVRMMRADYSGRGAPETRDGTQIHVFDNLGIRNSAPNDLSTFEAGWDEYGAVCVRHPRIAEKMSLKQIEASSSRLAHRVGRTCTRETASSLGARIFNSSRT